MSAKPLTKKEMNSSVTKMWESAIESTYRDLIEKAVLAERQACVKECKKLIKVFLSSKYSTGQPLSSFKERHAVAACIEAIEARGKT
jgi:hypothetical protein